MITRPVKYFIALIIASSLLFLADRGQVFSAGVEVVNRNLILPIVSSGTLAVEKTASGFRSVFLFRSFLKDFRNVESERDYYRGEYFRFLALEEENKLLRQSLELEGAREGKLVLAEVISFDPLRPNQFIIVSRGQNDGLKAGDPVILAGRILVGRTSEVDKKTSRVLLITSETSRLVTRLERSATNAVVAGSPSGTLLLDLVLPETNLEEGEIIVSSGVEGNIPPNLLIGQVSKVLSEETASFKKAVVRPFFSSQDLRQVFIMIQ